MCHLYSNTIESPCFEMQKNTSDYAVRLYGSPKAEVSAQKDVGSLLRCA